MSERTFPIHEWKRSGALPAAVPWAVVEPWRKRADRNHGQSLETLAARGGMCSQELWCAAHDKSLREMPPMEVADAWLLAVVEEADR